MTLNVSKRVWACGIVAGLLVPAVVLVAQEDAFRFSPTRPHTRDSPMLGGPPGSQGTALQTNTHALRSITVGEYMNRPARVRTTYSNWRRSAEGWSYLLIRDHDVGNTITWTSSSIQYPAGQTTTETVDIYDGATPEQQANQMRFVRAISICPSSGALTNNDRIKGVRLWWGTVPDGATDTLQVTGPGQGTNRRVEFARTNCNQNNGWLPRVECPSGHVAVGIKVHAQLNHGFTGVQLVCNVLNIRSEADGVIPTYHIGGTREGAPPRPNR